MMRDGTNEDMNDLKADYPKLGKMLSRLRRARRANREEKEDTCRIGVKKIKFGPQRVMEKMGVHPRVDGEATYAQFMEFLDRREVTRVLLYDEGNMAIVEIGVHRRA